MGYDYQSYANPWTSMSGNNTAQMTNGNQNPQFDNKNPSDPLLAQYGYRVQNNETASKINKTFNNPMGAVTDPIGHLKSAGKSFLNFVKDPNLKNFYQFQGASTPGSLLGGKLGSAGARMQQQEDNRLSMESNPYAGMPQGGQVYTNGSTGDIGTGYNNWNPYQQPQQQNIAAQSQNPWSYLRSS